MNTYAIHSTSGQRAWLIDPQTLKIDTDSAVEPEARMVGLGEWVRKANGKMFVAAIFDDFGVTQGNSLKWLSVDGRIVNTADVKNFKVLDLAVARRLSLTPVLGEPINVWYFPNHITELRNESIMSGPMDPILLAKYICNGGFGADRKPKS